MLYSEFPQGDLTATASLNALEISMRYLASVEDKLIINDTRNALARYFVPSTGGPLPSAQKRRRLSEEEFEAAFKFLESVSLDELNNSPDLSLRMLDQLDSAPAQRERVRRNLRDLVDWAREHSYLPFPSNPVSSSICNDIKVDQFKGIKLKPANSRQIFERCLEQLEKHTDKTDLSNAIVRFFVPGCGGPTPFHKPASSIEIDAALKYLERIPLEYLYKAPEIATEALKSFNLTLSQGTRVRHALHDLIEWAKTEQYLPYLVDIKPWSAEEKLISMSKLASEELKTAYEIYQSYCQYLTNNNKETEIPALKTAVVRYLVPFCEGPKSIHKRSTTSEVQSALEYLRTISIDHLSEAILTLNSHLSESNVNSSRYRSLISRLKTWRLWFINSYANAEINTSAPANPAQVKFNTFYTPGIQRPKKQVKSKSQFPRCSTYALCAKQFANDYINPYLEQQIADYEKWRLSNDVTPGSIKTEKEQMLQLLGWLHRYKAVPLESLCFEQIIAKSQLIFRVTDYTSYEEYLRQKEGGIQKSRDQADQDRDRIYQYLDFSGEHPGSQNRRVFIAISIAKFLYRDLIGTDDFPNSSHIPIIQRLLKIQADLSKKSRRTPQTVSYHDTSISWEQAITVMEKQRLRAEQTVVYFKTKGTRKGYCEKKRSDEELAEELQRFLSIAFTIIIPSRSRTFYDLRIGETLKEGLLCKEGLITVQDLQKQKDWEQHQNLVRFYIHHQIRDYKTGKNMPTALLENGGWWAEIPNISFGNTCLYDYIYRWLHWGRTVNGLVDHNFFFRRYHHTKPLTGGAWNNRIKRIIEGWTNVPVPPKNLRKIFSAQFPEHAESAALLLQHSEEMHRTTYDMRTSISKMEPIMSANKQFINTVLSSTSIQLGST